MKALQYIEDLTIAMLKEGKAGTKVSGLCHSYGMSDDIYFNQKANYAGMTVSNLKYNRAVIED